MFNDTDFYSNAELDEMGIAHEEICVEQTVQESLDAESEAFYANERGW